MTVYQSESGQTEARARLVSHNIISPPAMLIVSGILFIITRNSTLRSRPLTSTATMQCHAHIHTPYMCAHTHKHVIYIYS